jgi:predicted nucleotidyltransferase component of viral defense system
MTSLQEIEKFYPPHLQQFKQFILREYLQYKVLGIIFESEFAQKLCFLGGTCLRIVHNNTRFSEDLDFDNFNLTEQNFIEVSKSIEKQLTREGYDVEIRNVFKGAFHCYIKFPKLLFGEGLSGHIEEKILIQLDTEPQHFEFQPQPFILNKFDVFTQINITPLDILLSQKINALINRKRRKGRDFFDMIFLLKITRPNYEYLTQKLSIANENQLKETILMVCAETNLAEMANDVEPFLFSPGDSKYIKLFTEYIQQTFK